MSEDPQVTRARVPPGEYQTLAESRTHRRSLFLRMMAQEAPETLRSLRDDVLPTYISTYDEVEKRLDSRVLDSDTERYSAPGRRACLCCQPALLTKWQTYEAVSIAENHNRYPDLALLRGKVEEWARRYRLNTRWVLAAALVQLDFWRRYPKSAEGLTLGWSCFFHPISFALEETPVPAELLVPWDPLWETRKEYEKNHQVVLGKYLDGIEAQAVAAGCQPTTDLPALQLHFTWLIRYQLGRESWPEIAATAGRRLKKSKTMVDVSEKFVARTVKDLARSIDLPLIRVRGPGRPAGSRTKNTTGNRVR